MILECLLLHWACSRATSALLWGLYVNKEVKKIAIREVWNIIWACSTYQSVGSHSHAEVMLKNWVTVGNELMYSCS